MRHRDVHPRVGKERAVPHGHVDAKGNRWRPVVVAVPHRVAAHWATIFPTESIEYQLELVSKVEHSLVHALGIRALDPEGEGDTFRLGVDRLGRHHADVGGGGSVKGQVGTGAVWGGGWPRWARWQRGGGRPGCATAAIGAVSAEAAGCEFGSGSAVVTGAV